MKIDIKQIQTGKVYFADHETSSWFDGEIKANEPFVIMSVRIIDDEKYKGAIAQGVASYLNLKGQILKLPLIYGMFLYEYNSV